MRKGALIGRGKTADVYEWGSHAVLKLFHPGKSIGNEAYNARIIYDLGIPSPEVIDVVELEGCQGIIYERLHGITLTRAGEPTIDSITKNARILAEFQTYIHSFTIDHPPNLRQRLIDGIGHISYVDEEKKQQAIDLLNQLPDGNAICHFDLHPDNVMITDKGLYLIDWADVLVGHPLADVCWTSMLLGSDAMPAGDPPELLKNKSLRMHFHEVYLDTYFKLNPNYNKEDLSAWIQPIAMHRLGLVVE